jgi:protein involved in polysaccharide export with SLBB domain
MNLKEFVRLSIVWTLAASFTGAARAQESQTPPRGPAAPPADIVKDNLDRAAATPEQVLEALNKDPGLLLEFKQVLARDAGLSGQILEEADLSESAIADRLHIDLHSRILATALLRRYGYLMPRINPDSDLAAEHTLILRERAKEIERASASRKTAAESSRQERTIDCDQENSSMSAPSTPTPEKDRRFPEEPPRDQKQKQLLRATDGEVPDDLPTDTLHDDHEPAAGPSPALPQRTLLAFGRQTDGELEGSRLEPHMGEAAQDGYSLQPSVSESSTTPPPVRPSPDAIASESHRLLVAGISRGGLLWHGRREQPPAAYFEPVRMEHRPSPYADVPSLYDLYVQAAPSNRKLERFGLDVFRRGIADPDLLPMDLPVGPEYVVGPGDGLSVNVWGGVSQRFFRTVDREGRVLLPEVGAVLVSGHTLGEVQETVQNALRTQFRRVSAEVSLLKLRTVRVYVVGEVASPGGYDISSLSTALNALFAAGGVTPIGSLRRLEHYRGKQLIEEVDAYDLLLHGVRGELHRLENGDSLRVPPPGPVVTVDGMVRRPAGYELRREKNLGEVLELAGGILPAAALRHIEVQRLQAHERRTMLSLDIGETNNQDLLRSAFEKFAIQDGDEIHIFPIAPYNTNAVFLEGHVLRPGRYSYRQGMKLGDLVASYDDLLPEPAGRYAEIIHVAAADHQPVVEGFDLAAALAHPEVAPEIKPLDTIRLFGRYDFEGLPEILVTGEVHSPGRYRINGQLHLRDALYQAGGATPEAWLDAGQIFRREPDGTTMVFSANLSSALAGNPLDNILLQPRDRILIHRQPQRVDPPSVIIGGEVARPGRYPLTANMRVSDLLRSAGGLLRSANPSVGDLNHYNGSRMPPNSLQAAQLQKVDLLAALAGENAENFSLRDGDVLTVPQQSGWKDIGATVTIRGEVARPGVYGIQPGEHLSSLLQRSGGLLSSAYPQAAVFERVSVREMQQQTRRELIQRLEQEGVTLKTSLTITGTEEASLRQNSIQQKDRMLEALRKAPISGRMVIHIRQVRGFVGSSNDVELRAGDSLQIPKQPGFVLVVGQVFNTNALTYTPRKNASWYLSRAGGATPFANKAGIFILRSSGEVTSGTNGMWSGGVLASTIEPGDTIIVPEKAVLGSSTAWKNIVAIAQVAQAAALAAAVAIP